MQHITVLKSIDDLARAIYLAVKNGVDARSIVYLAKRTGYSDEQIMEAAMKAVSMVEE